MSGFNVGEIVGNRAEEGILLDRFSQQAGALRLAEGNRQVVIPFASSVAQRPHIVSGTLLDAAPKRYGEQKERHIGKRGKWRGAFLRAKSDKVSLDGFDPLYVGNDGALGLPSIFGIPEKPEYFGRACFARASARSKHDAVFVLYPDHVFVCVDGKSRACAVTWDGFEFNIDPATPEQVVELYYGTALQSTYAPFVSTLLRGMAMLEYVGVEKARRRVLYTHRDSLNQN